MKILFLILAVIAVLVLLGGALNHETQVSLDYLVGSTPGVSMFWFALGVGAGLLLAGLAGWSVGRAGGGETRAKLERELESTYRRLRDCEARLLGPSAPVADVTPTAVAPAVEAVTVAAPVLGDEAVTVAAPADAPETVTATVPSPPDEAVTAMAAVPDAEAETVVTGDAGETETVVAPAPPEADDAEDTSAS